MTVKYLPKVEKQLGKFDRPTKERIVSYMNSVAMLGNPRSKGRELKGTLRGLYRYRVGDYRVVCEIHDAELVIMVVEIGHRREVYKK